MRAIPTFLSIVLVAACHEASSAPAPLTPSTVPVVAVPSASAVASSPTPVAPSASASAPAPPTRGSYAPLPRVVACDACTWKGTGCIEGSTKKCALDPDAWWEIRVGRARPALASQPDDVVCVADACAKTTKAKVRGFTVLAPEKPGAATVAISTTQLVGLEQVNVGAGGRSTPAVVVPTLAVGAALFRDGVTFRNADGDEAWVSIAPGKPPSPLPESPVTVDPPESPQSAAAPQDFARARALAAKAKAIDARLADYRRKTVLTHRRSGFEVRLVAFYDGAALVKVVGEFPYIPPLVDTSYYFDAGRLIVEHSIISGMPNEAGESLTVVQTAFIDERGIFWDTSPEFVPKKIAPRDGAALLREITKALADPNYHVADETL